MTPLFHPLRVKKVTPDTQEAVIVTFEVPPDLREVFGFTQGQYLTLRKDIAGEDMRRSYSICAGVDDGELRVGVRKVKGGVLEPDAEVATVKLLRERFGPRAGLRIDPNAAWSVETSIRVAEKLRDVDLEYLANLLLSQGKYRSDSEMRRVDDEHRGCTQRVFCGGFSDFQPRIG